MKLPNVSTAEPPKTLLDKIIFSTPVVMTVVATILAGLSGSEMSQAQYHRSLAAQEQSKASDQWALFQAKRQRGVMASQTADLMQTLGDSSPFSLNALTKLTAATQPSPDLQAAADALAKPTFPPINPRFDDASVTAAYQALARGESETADPAIFSKINVTPLHEALRKAERATQDAESDLDPTTSGLDQIVKAVARLTAPGQPATPATKQIATDFAAARLRFEDAREHHEAKLNQVTAFLYEIEVRKASLDSERHRTRSSYFFIGMLAAQAAVTIATIALAAKVRSTLWILAATIGLLAVAYAGYVYLFT